MKEKITIRLYDLPRQPDFPDGEPYAAAESVAGWDHPRGAQIGLHERQGGYLMGVIDHLHPEIHQDETGRYKIAELWTQD